MADEISTVPERNAGGAGESALVDGLDGAGDGRDAVQTGEASTEMSESSAASGGGVVLLATLIDLALRERERPRDNA